MKCSRQEADLTQNKDINPKNKQIMKKALFTLALAGFAFAANAQFVVGGQLGFNTTGGTNSYEQNGAAAAYDVPNTKTTGLTIAPSVGYVLNEKMQAGLSINYTFGTTTTYTALAYANDKETYSKINRNTFEIAPYFRYYFATVGKFNFFCQAELGLALQPRTSGHNYNNNVAPNTPVTDVDTKGATSTTTLRFSVTPGVNYRINERFSADLYIDLAGLTFEHTSTKTYGANVGTGASAHWDEDFLVNTNKDNTFRLNANTSDQTLMAHLNNFRLGFNYHF